MPLCAVEEWIILDAIVTDAERAKVAAAGCQPMFMFAHKVVDDEQRRFEPGHWVRSSMGTAFNDGFLFETRNTVYVLLGQAIVSLLLSKRYFPFSDYQPVLLGN